MTSTPARLPYALGSADFAALTAIFAKEGIDSDFATLLRTRRAHCDCRRDLFLVSVPHLANGSASEWLPRAYSC